MGDIIQESRAALSRYTRAASSESAVKIMQERIEQFDLLLGGVGHDVGETAIDAESRRRQKEVIEAVKQKLTKSARGLAVVRT